MHDAPDAGAVLGRLERDVLGGRREGASGCGTRGIPAADSQVDV